MNPTSEEVVKNLQGSNDDWRTPDWLFKALDTEFAFTLDGAADESNHKCDRWIGCVEGEQKFLPVERVFCNPPYSNIAPFVQLALERPDDLWVFIVPTRMRSQWMEDLRHRGRAEFRWLRKRIAFGPPPGVKESSPRMDVCVVVVRPRGRA